MAEDLEILARDFLDFGRELRSLERTVLPEMAAEMERVTKQNLLESVDAYGAPLLPLKDGSGRRPLMKTLTLFNRVRGFVRGRYAVVECDAVQARIQNQGGTINKAERRRAANEKPWVFQGAGGGTIFTRHIRAHSVVIPRREFIGPGKRMFDACVAVVVRAAERAFGKK